MTIDAALALVLERLSDGQIEALAATCEPAATPDRAPELALAGATPSAASAVDGLRLTWSSTPNLTGAGIALALRAGLTARRAADSCRARSVWTGPGAQGEQRLTAAVLHELLTSARQRILLASYAAYTLPEIAADLEAAVARGCRVDVVFETTEGSAGAYNGPHNQPFGTIANITRWHWPADHRSGGAVLHAKLLVIDGERAFVGSANLTSRALAHNLEIGVLLTDPTVATDLEHHVRGLMRTAILRES